jgi:hypothetical protein
MATVAVKVTLVPIREVLFGLDEASVVTVPSSTFCVKVNGGPA